MATAEISALLLLCILCDAWTTANIITYEGAIWIHAHTHDGEEAIMNWVKNSAVEVIPSTSNVSVTKFDIPS